MSSAKRAKPDTKYLAIRRDERFSPNSVEKDLLILQSVCDELKRREQLESDIPIVDESAFTSSTPSALIYLTMARSEQTLSQLEGLEAEGRIVVNSVAAVRICRRQVLDALMRKKHVPMPPLQAKFGMWLKRGDEAAQSIDDVRFCKDEQELIAAKNDFKQRGITNWVVSAHVPGDLVKFYGVGSRMFEYFYPWEDGMSKFGDEIRNGQPHYYKFDSEALKSEVIRLSKLVGTDFYGGDAIIDQEGNFYIIDFNDWPSFSRCRDKAVAAMCSQIEKKQKLIDKKNTK